MDSYSPDARKITIKAFDDSTYPFGAGYWKGFEQVSMPKITSVHVPTSITEGSKLEIPVLVTPNATVYYYFTDQQGKIIDEGKQQVSQNGSMKITLLPEKTMNLDLGSNDVQMFVVSDAAYKPDMYHSSFLVTKGQIPVPEDGNVASNTPLETSNVYLIGGIILAAAILIAFFIKKRRTTNGV